MIDSNSEEKSRSVRKTHASIAFGSKTPLQIIISIYANQFLAIYFAFMTYSSILWDRPNRSLSLQTANLTPDSSIRVLPHSSKIILPALWNVCDFFLQINSTVAHFPGRQNTVADILSRLDHEPDEKVHLTKRNDIQTTHFHVQILRPDVLNECTETIGILERCHVSLKESLKISADERLTSWHGETSLKIFGNREFVRSHREPAL